MKTVKGSLPPRWTVGRARAQFAGLLKAAERAPQEIYHRNRLRAVVVKPDLLQGRAGTERTVPPRSVWEATEEIRRIARETGWDFPDLPKRRDRPNAFLAAPRRRSR